MTLESIVDIDNKFVKYETLFRKALDSILTIDTNLSLTHSDMHYRNPVAQLLFIEETMSNILCPCGMYHPEGQFCEQGHVMQPVHDACDCGKTSNHAHEHDTAPEQSVHDCCKPCEGEREPELLQASHSGIVHEAESCACHKHAPAEALDKTMLGKASATCAVYRIVNMDCPMEEALIRKKLGSMPGISEMEFNLMQRVLTVHHTLASTVSIEAALKSIDMTPEPLGQSEPMNMEAAPSFAWGKLALAGIFAALSEAIELMQDWSVLPFGFDLSGIPLSLPLVFAVLSIALGGLTTYRKGWLALKNGNLNINALMSVAVTGAVIIGHYPEAAMVMVLFNLSEVLEARALDKARNAIRHLMEMTPEKATAQQADGMWLEMDIREVVVGSKVRVRPGEKVALDGVVVQGHSAINQAPITGESMPVEKGQGDTVYAGTINESGSFEFEVTALASQSTLARIIHAVEEAQGSRAPIQRFVDQFARYYTPAVFLVAILTALVPPLLGAAWAESIYTALVILVIGCPCALVISTPVTIVSGMAAATRHGILIKGGLFLEQGRKLTWLALDKTGTITHGKPTLTDVMSLGQMEQSRAVRIASSIAARSDHPVSRAIAQDAKAKNIALLEVDDFTAIAGQGVCGYVEGALWRLGNVRMVEDSGLPSLSPAVANTVQELEKQGKSMVLLMNESGVQALFAVADTLKESSVEAIAELKRLGVKTMMLTGDNSHTAQTIAAQVNVDDFRGNLLPEDKLRVIENLENSHAGAIGMVGDGINDAPALARASIGFAMAAAGTDAAIETADVALMDDDLRKIPRFIRLSRATYAILVQNIALAIGVKAVFLLLALTGQATMWMAVFADVGTSLLVVANGLRAMKK